MKKKILWVYILFLRKYADKFCVDNACCVMIMDTCCHLTDGGRHKTARQNGISWNRMAEETE